MELIQIPTRYEGNGKIVNIGQKLYREYNNKILPLTNRRIVFKAGSTLVDPNTNPGYIEKSAYELTRLEKKWNNDVIFVTSGSISTGKNYLINKSDDKTVKVVKGMKNDESAFLYQFKMDGNVNLYSEPSLAAIGQTILMKKYFDAFGQFSQVIGQALFTREDIENGKKEPSKRYKNTVSTLEDLLKNKSIPIINENDTTATEEIIFGDNDILAAHVAIALHADLVIYNTSGNGFFDRKDGKNGKLINVIIDTDDYLHSIAEGSTKNADGSYQGRGGMKSTIQAIELLKPHGIPALVIGQKDANFENISHYTHNGTLFLNK